jgi:hypothetical protein
MNIRSVSRQSIQKLRFSISKICRSQEREREWERVCVCEWERERNKFFFVPIFPPVHFTPFYLSDNPPLFSLDFWLNGYDVPCFADRDLHLRLFRSKFAFRAFQIFNKKTTFFDAKNSLLPPIDRWSRNVKKSFSPLKHRLL